ncbi:MAG: VOC family protein [Pseudomonadota bacterium]|nr:VOC family protein [Pseudomonadota bacterium]
MTKTAKVRAVGINHVAIEVGNIDAALAFYSQFFDFTLRGKSETDAFIDLGDQFIALSKADPIDPESGRHFGLVVDDKERFRALLAEAGVVVEDRRFLDFRDPWGNMVEIVAYENVQFSKAPNVLRGMGMSDLRKNDKAVGELRSKGMSPD